MDVNDPKDKFKAVWLILFMLGLGTLLPWNFFMTATMYFNHRLADPTTANVTKVESRNALQARFNNTMTLCAMIPLLIFTCLTSIIHQRIPQKIRILGSLVAIWVVFCVTAILVKLAINPVAFFVITMIKIVIINAFGAILQGSLFGMAGVLPDGYTTPIMSGQGLAGTFAALAMICAIASGSDLMDCAFGYFITACVVISLAIVSYIILPNLDFYRYYQEKKQKNPSLQEEKTIQLIKNEDSGGGMSTGEKVQRNPSLLSIFKKIWVMALSVCFAFTVTICAFPAVAVDVKSTIANGGLWEKYFIPVSGFLLFNLCDWLGRSLTAVCSWPGKDSKLLPALLLARLMFVPLLMLCNVQPRTAMPVYFSHDAWFTVFIMLFALSSGYLASLCMCFYSKNPPSRPHYPRIRSGGETPSDLHTSSTLSALQRTVLYKHAALFPRTRTKTDTSLLQYLQHVATTSKKWRRRRMEMKKKKKKRRRIKRRRKRRRRKKKKEEEEERKEEEEMIYKRQNM